VGHEHVGISESAAYQKAALLTHWLGLLTVLLASFTSCLLKIQK
jgi:hypothetical protein